MCIAKKSPLNGALCKVGRQSKKQNMWSEIESLKARTDALEALCKEQASCLQELRDSKQKLLRVMKVIDSFESHAGDNTLLQEKVEIIIKEPCTGAHVTTDISLFVYPDKITSQGTQNIPYAHRPDVGQEIIIHQLVKPLSTQHVQHAVDIMNGIGRCVNSHCAVAFIVKYLLTEPSRETERFVKLKFDVLSALEL